MCDLSPKRLVKSFPAEALGVKRTRRARRFPQDTVDSNTLDEWAQSLPKCIDVDEIETESLCSTRATTDIDTEVDSESLSDDVNIEARMKPIEAEGQQIKQVAARSDEPELANNWFGEHVETIEKVQSEDMKSGTPIYTKFNRLVMADDIGVCTKAEYNAASNTKKSSYRKNGPSWP